MKSLIIVLSLLVGAEASAVALSCNAAQSQTALDNCKKGAAAGETTTVKSCKFDSSQPVGSQYDVVCDYFDPNGIHREGKPLSAGSASGSLLNKGTGTGVGAKTGIATGRH